MQGYYRRADANLGMGRMKKALADFKRAATVAPRDPDLRKKLLQCEREVKRIRFEEALAAPVKTSTLTLLKQSYYQGVCVHGMKCICITTLSQNPPALDQFNNLGCSKSKELPLQEEKPVAEEIDLSRMPVDDSYDGPMMEGMHLHTSRTSLIGMLPFERSPSTSSVVRNGQWQFRLSVNVHRFGNLGRP